MKNTILVILSVGLFVLGSCRDGKRYHSENARVVQLVQEDPIDEILNFQKEMNESFRDPEVSPLNDNQRKDFDGLDFFDPDTTYRVVARLVRTPEALPFLMPTTTERKSRERVYGIAHFSFGSEVFELEVYQNIELLDEPGYEDYLFLPFTDATNGKTTYSGGRYIDLSIPDGDSLLIDFNRSYNPYCVYNEEYSCPIVPAVNHLEIEVLAGIKDYNKKEP